MRFRKTFDLTAGLCLLASLQVTTADRPAAYAQGSDSNGVSEQTISSAPKPVKMLTGRLEEVGGNGASLPVGVVLKLKTQTAKADPLGERQRPQMVTGQVESFPMDWRGAWSGQLKVHARQAARIAYDFDADETRMEDKIFTPGTLGAVEFDFNQRGRDVELEPARITFPPRTDTAQAKANAAQLRALGLDRMMGGDSSMLSMLTAGIPVFLLGNTSGVRGVTGNVISSQVLKNDIRELKPGVLEQNIVVRGQDQSIKTGAVEHTYSESVLRFTKLSQNQLYVQAASIKYRKDGLFESKVLMYGTVNRGAAAVTTYPGAFPGMPASGLGGAADLNNLFKSLQGL